MIIAITVVTYGSEPKGALRYYYTHALGFSNSKEELFIQMDFDRLARKKLHGGNRK